MQIKTEWDDDAERLLAKSDRLMSAAIKEEFERNPLSSTAKIIDPAQHLYTTSVAGNRYSVLWVMDSKDGAETARVRAVVPAEFSEIDGETIKVQVNAYGTAELGRRFDLV
jgi:hypothetical protein